MNALLPFFGVLAITPFFLLESAGVLAVVVFFEFDFAISFDFNYL